MAIIGSSAKRICPPMTPLIMEYKKNAALASANHFTLIGMTKKSLTTKSGNNTAKAKNIDKLMKSGVRKA
jgi:hypothetical protein